jgi:starvation-inducible outer membrane lipoprotein
MKTLIILSIAATLTGCANVPPPTAEQLAAYQQITHSTISGGLQDYKTIRAIK